MCVWLIGYHAERSACYVQLSFTRNSTPGGSSIFRGAMRGFWLVSALGSSASGPSELTGAFWSSLGDDEVLEVAESGRRPSGAAS